MLPDFLFKSAKRFMGCLDSLLMPTFHEHCNSLHQSEKQSDTVILLILKVNCNIHETLALTID